MIRKDNSMDEGQQLNQLNVQCAELYRLVCVRMCACAYCKGSKADRQGIYVPAALT